MLEKKNFKGEGNEASYGIELYNDLSLSDQIKAVQWAPTTAV